MDYMRLFFGFLCLSIAATLFTKCEGRVSKQLLKHIHPFRQVSSPQIAINKKADQLKIVKHLGMDDTGSTLSNTQPYVSSPFTLPPFDSLAPMPLPQNTPPYCEYPPSTPQPPSTVMPSPTTYTVPPPSPETSYFPPIFPIENPPPSPASNLPSPPESSTLPNPPEYSPSPPSFAPGTPDYIPSPPSPPAFVPGTPDYIPSPPSPSAFVPGTPEYVPSPPDYYVPGPPDTAPGTPGYEPSPPTYYPSPSGYTPSPIGYTPSPIGYTPSPIGYTPSPTVFQPPVIYPPPAVPPPPYKGPHFTLWCVAKPSVPDPIIEEAMSYACGSGADCSSIQPDGTCYKPVTLFAHASYAFNSYWQRTKAAGGTCDFGGTGMLVTVDPSFDGCHFIYY
ncbi:hypothetical protein AQUCO_03000306v1 [Aquilegia coerulea]|uniref:X8 domain-containing protein n=1 Tax=Aquilegia coerulea TaxID=218851 RepID=A0A2G5D2D0_AQUCA|nr:hypothetical protein AQUCO_03000306v1 [Aquilegia coerulea]